MKESGSYCVGADERRAPVRWATSAREPGAGAERGGGHVHAGWGGGGRKAGQAGAALLPRHACLLILICIHRRQGSHLMAARFWLLPQVP